MQLLRIAFPVVSSQAWLGGFNYQQNLCRALATHATGRIKVVACFGEDAGNGDLAAFADIPNIEIIQHPVFSRTGQNFRLVRTLLFGSDNKVNTIFSTNRINIVFESARFYGRNLQASAIAWFPDLQHRHLPDLFSRIAWWRRELGFRMQLRYGRTILVSSKDTQHDCEQAYPKSKGVVRVLHFPAMVSQADFAIDPRIIQQRYGIPERFIYLPNQFWRHKNHEVVVEALGILQQQKSIVNIVSTGNTCELQNPGFFDHLMERLEAVGASSMFQALGILPREHVIALIRTCSAFINPSNFEGWSSGVEEAKYFGTPMILSNIAVHREQAGINAKYFNVNDAGLLAGLLNEAMQYDPVSPRLPQHNPSSELKVFAEAFTTIAEETYSNIAK